MKVKQLIEILQALSPDADVYLDEDGYPSIDGAYDPVNYDMDEDDMPPSKPAVLLEYSENE